MKVLALNSSPRGGDQSKTALMLDHLVQGLRDAGAEVEIVELRHKTIRYCAGCFTCWTKTPGVCIHKDDMTKELFPEWLDSDLVVYASPLYHFHLNAAMKTFIERTLPVLQPFFDQHDGRTHHPLRHQFPKAVFLSVAGFPEMEIFSQLSAWANFVYGRHGNLVAEIYRPAAETMATAYFKNKAEDVLAAVRQAGREIVELGRVSPETMTQITQDIVEDKEKFSKMGNVFWRTCLDEGVTPKEFVEKSLVPRPNDLESFLLIMSLGFNPAKAGDAKAIIQFNFSGQVQGACHFRIENGSIQPGQEAAERPDLIIETPFEVWADIMTGKADGQRMFLEQKYKIDGDLNLLLRFNELFGK
ncbi:MAG: NAD(P)H-dependent oxidoreductase [Thermodesulfobacteriota bacterium]